MERDTQVVRVAGNRTGSLVPETVNNVAFGYPDAQGLEAVFADRRPGFVYSRLGNPTVTAFEQRMAVLESGVGAVAFASGMAAISAVVLALVRQGDNIVACRQLFGGTLSLFTHTLSKFGVDVRYFAPGEEAKVADLVDRRTAFVFVETLSNPALCVADLPVLAEAKKQVPLIVDATCTPPVDWSAKEAGADVVIHSATKALAGHGRVLGGVVVDTGRFAWKDVAARYGLEDEARTKRSLCFLAMLKKRYLADLGGCLAPQAAQEILAGVETLVLRVRRAQDNALRLAQALAAHPKVAAVRYVGMPDDPQHAVAQSVLRGAWGSLLTFDVGSRERAYQVLSRLRTITISTNLGDTRTLAVHPATTIGHMLTGEQRVQAGITEGMIRVSVGVEHPDDLIADLVQACDGLE